jgi:type I pantothenate kinase
VDLVTTDGFLYPAAELNRRHMMGRKGYPESYDQRALMQFVTAVKSGAAEVPAPMYSHETYDRLDEVHVVDRPDILIIEGLNVLQTGPSLMVSDLFDFSVYVDADRADIERWYIDRFLKLKNSAFRNPGAHFHYYAGLSDEDARWSPVRSGRPPTCPTWWRTSCRPGPGVPGHAKGPDHLVETVRMRKI